jgi:hypothetical protein
MLGRKRLLKVADSSTGLHSVSALTTSLFEAITERAKREFMGELFSVGNVCNEN